MPLKDFHLNLYNAGVNYGKADAHIRGKYNLTKENQIALLKEAKSLGYEGVLVLATCNRTEIIGFVEHPYQLIKLLCKYSEGNVEEFAKISNVYKNKDAIAHLFRIGCGLESQILGDYEIVGQLKAAFKLSKTAKTTNAYLERLLNLVFQASKKVKNNTKLSSGTTSVSYAAVQYVIHNLPDYNSRKIVVFGLGKIGKSICKNLVEYTKNKSITLINRTEKKTETFVKEYPSIHKSAIVHLRSEIATADVLIVATSANKPTITG